jgi:zinc-ribbon domain
MLTVRCPTCGSTLGLGDEMLGQQVRCGGCQEVFVAEAPPPRRDRRDDEDEDRPRKRPARRDDDDDRDRPSRRRSRRDDDDEVEEPAPRRPRRKRKLKKVAPGKPGLATAAAILWLIWGGLGALLTIFGLIGLFYGLDRGAPASFVIAGTFQTLITGAMSYYLVIAGLEILNGQAENTANSGFIVLTATGVLLVMTVVRSAYYTSDGRLGPGFQAAAMAVSCGLFLIVASGVILGGIFALVANKGYEKWVRS